MKPNPSKAWSRGQCGSIAIDYGEFVIEGELKSSDARGYDYFEKHTH